MAAAKSLPSSVKDLLLVSPLRQGWGVVLLCVEEYQDQDDSYHHLRSCYIDEQVTHWDAPYPHQDNGRHKTTA